MTRLTEVIDRCGLVDNSDGVVFRDSRPTNARVSKLDAAVIAADERREVTAKSTSADEAGILAEGHQAA